MVAVAVVAVVVAVAVVSLVVVVVAVALALDLRILFNKSTILCQLRYKGFGALLPGRALRGVPGLPRARPKAFPE